MKRLWLLGWRAMIIVLAMLLIYQGWLLAHIVWWINHDPSTSAFMESRLEALQNRDPSAQLRHKWVPYDRISSNLKHALIAAEDAKFVDHEGFDWEGIQKAYEKNLRKGRIVAGGSTISQQLAKNLFLSTKRSPWRKLEEAAITVMLETVLSKRRIFEIYLNIIEWGNGVFGAEAAAQYYFQTSASHISPEQAAWLAAIVPNPRYYEKHREAPGMLLKADYILTYMDFAEIP